MMFGLTLWVASGLQNATIAPYAPVLSDKTPYAPVLSDSTPRPPLSADQSPIDEQLNFVSRTLGSSMVLQRAPQRAVIWGHTTPGANVTTEFNGALLVSTADADGTWRQTLPPMPASTTPFTIAINSTAGESATLTDVVFGDVFLCGGQSNMEFAMPGVTNHSDEKQYANDYPLIRFFSVGHATQSPTPLRDLQTVWEPWQVASNETIGQNWSPGHTMFSTFSAVCWLFGRRVFDGLKSANGGEPVPIGLISNNWGGTAIEAWSPASAFEACGRDVAAPPMYNAMVHPYTLGPMSLRGFTWYQGEANTKDAASAEDYRCLFPAMISSWRTAFANPHAYFGFVQLSTWCAEDEQSIPQMREAQMGALSLRNVGWATNADHGFGCDIHPRAKQYIGKRLGDSALGLEYGLPGLELRYPYNYDLEGQVPDMDPPMAPLNCSADHVQFERQCAWASLRLEGLCWLNASVSISATGHELVLSAALPALDAGGRNASSGGPRGNQSAAVRLPAITGSAYGWGPIPLMSAYDKASGLPVLPWNRSLP